jgi:hypothetical protein
MVVIMQWQGKSLKTPTSLHGILDLEFAGNHVRLNELITVWEPANVYINIGLDFIFIISYVSFFLEACRFINYTKTFRKSTKTIGILSISAGILDILENFFMLRAFSATGGKAIAIAGYFAAAKFFLIAVVVLFIIASFTTIIIKKRL